MNVPRFTALFVTLLLATSPAGAEDAAGEDNEMKPERSYFFGYSFGNMLRDGGNSDVDLEVLLEGLKDSLRKAEPRLSSQQQADVINIVRARQLDVQQQAQQREAQAGQLNLEAAQQFLAANGAREGIQKTASGLQYQVMIEGNGVSPTAGSRVKVHYTGRLLGPDGQLNESDSTIFDSSRKRGEPATFGLSQVIAGWTEGLQLMKPGGQMRFFIPPELGYGPGGTRGIPPNSVLVFDVELIEIVE